MNIAKTIQELRARAGVSQADAAQGIGIARATYASIETGRRSLNIEVAQQISKYYGIKIEDLINGDIGLDESVHEPTVEYKQVECHIDEIVAHDITPEFKPEKLRQVMLYILSKVGAKPNVGETVLYKLLYFIDFNYYEKTGNSVTGLTYIHNKYGPSPSVSFRSLVKEMESAKELEIVETRFYKKMQRKYLPLKNIKLSELSADELRHIDETLAELSDKSASELSALSHQDTPWIVAKQGQPIDYRDTFYRTTATAVTEPDDEL